MCKNGQIGKIDNILTIFPVNSLHFRELPRRFAKIYQRSLPSLLQSPNFFRLFCLYCVALQLGYIGKIASLIYLVACFLSKQ